MFHDFVDSGLLYGQRQTLSTTLNELQVTAYLLLFFHHVSVLSVISSVSLHYNQVGLG